ncbi:MAG: hypothetical protein H0U76_16130 [Ktedonobacteraceae bacterium]|nr:hypothetical protein [Ktedonobacteraceae bacterium]
MARPPKEIDEHVVLELSKIACTVQEIANVVGCSKDTLERRFMELMEEGRAMAKQSLRRMQWKSAESGNVTMQIWLGKQLLEQRDKPKDEIPEGSQGVQLSAEQFNDYVTKMIAARRADKK